jgi:hypothetical protein
MGSFSEAEVVVFSLISTAKMGSFGRLASVLLGRSVAVWLLLIMGSTENWGGRVMVTSKLI